MHTEAPPRLTLFEDLKNSGWPGCHEALDIHMVIEPFLRHFSLASYLTRIMRIFVFKSEHFLVENPQNESGLKLFLFTSNDVRRA